jgi:hypothetical protein
VKILLDNGTELVYEIYQSVILLFGIEKECSPCGDMAAERMGISGGSVEERSEGFKAPLVTNAKSFLEIKCCLYGGKWYYCPKKPYEKGGDENKLLSQ